MEFYKNNKAVFHFCLGVLTSGIIFYGIVENRLNKRMHPSDFPWVQTQGTHLSAPSFTETAKIANRTVVAIRTTKAAGTEEDDLLVSAREGFGSGVIVSEDGYILTNLHVIEGAQNIRVQLWDKKETDAEVVGKDEYTDLALIKIKAKKLNVASFGNSDAIFPGEWVMACGNPYNMSGTITTGVISARHRAIGAYRAGSWDHGMECFLQTDAAMNPGSSGGGLFNLNGQCIGINTAIASESGTSEGYGFAIPSNVAFKIMTDLKKYGKVNRGWLGMQLEENVDGSDIQEASGALVLGLKQNSPAQIAGIQKGDVIVKWGEKQIENAAAFQEAILQAKPNESIQITLIRGQKQIHKKLTLVAQLK